MDTIEKDLRTIQIAFIDAQLYLEALLCQIESLEAAGIYDAPPTESWQDRGGKGRYLYFYFPQRRDGEGYCGPGGRRKLYIGAHPTRIDQARRRAQRTRNHRQLHRDVKRLQRWLEQRTAELHRLAQHLAAWTTHRRGS